ncbi:MAG: helix-turn-helix transcriptional regulator [Candidatus Acidiferrum sp.]
MKNLKKRRRAAGYTQYQLAAKTGIHRWRISHCELGLLKLTEQEQALIGKTLRGALEKLAHQYFDHADRLEKETDLLKQRGYFDETGSPRKGAEAEQIWREVQAELRSNARTAGQ